MKNNIRINCKISHVFLMLLLVIMQTDFATVFAQTTISREEIPSDIPLDVKEQIKKLYSVEPKERVLAIVSLGNMGEKAILAIPFLIASFKDHQEIEMVIYVGKEKTFTAAGTAVKVLVKIGKPAVPYLISSLKTPNTDIRELSALCLGKIKNIEAVEPLITLLKDKEWIVRWTTVRALAAIKDTRATGPLIDKLTDDNIEVRRQAVYALGMIKDHRAVKPLIDALLNENNFFKKKSCRRIDRNNWV